ncbi:hypothetical protein KAFR_0L00720 [Kazachstania africana CBS 2517]|uniref:Peroxin/Ferlin domain-containing protein n=1 Tax=Kazachstania africana (strain ATCC 22294 / BCRC 22015 / CBS 2517 / CECT 1963 / NBRC 1671 / NRRL Y-8276) TaxID=1071382 RepID=H2B229_KAZAF|nr:hypothetical protein KAFR_0L00720 [Kazachstania africana CBS 2517]CCF60679.1 hypothetical protein KAFR_0L00720 [Kazachstania africana CBS 2517]
MELNFLHNFNFSILGDKNLIIENQRGLILLGYPFFSPSLLLPILDPPEFQLVFLKDNLSNIAKITCLNKISNKTSNCLDQLFPLDSECVKEKQKWYVLMACDDIDDQGWCYSWTFNNRRWKSKNGIVRRRIWIKLPELNPLK